MASKPPSTKYFIGVRDPDNICHDIWGTVKMATGRYANMMSTVAYKQFGIKKSRLGQKISYYAATEEEVERLASEGSSTLITLTYGKRWNPLIVVDRFKIRESYEEALKHYNSLENKKQTKFDDLLIQYFVENKILDQVGEDQPVKKTKHYNIHNVRVGDVIDLKGWPYYSQHVKVVKISESGFWFNEIEVERPTNEITSDISKLQIFLKKFKNVKIGNCTHNRYDIFIPYQDNEEHFTLSSTKYKRWKESIKKVDSYCFRAYIEGEFNIEPISN